MAINKIYELWLHFEIVRNSTQVVDKVAIAVIVHDSSNSYVTVTVLPLLQRRVTAGNETFEKQISFCVVIGPVLIVQDPIVDVPHLWREQRRSSSISAVSFLPYKISDMAYAYHVKCTFNHQ